MTETTSENQVQIWKEELATAMTGEQWKPALKLCSWLRYTLQEQGASDPEVEEAHRQAKEGLADQAIRTNSQQESEAIHARSYEKRRTNIMHQIIAGRWDKALDSIEELHEDGISRHEIVDLLRELRARTASLLAPSYRRVDNRAARLGRRFDELVQRVHGAPLMGASRSLNDPME